MIPHDAKLFNLREGTKHPIPGTHGHLDAVCAERFVQTGTNYGISLDGQFILVDIDRPDCDEATLFLGSIAELDTWRQLTPHGLHYLFRCPGGWTGTNVALTDQKGRHYGDLKSKGYLVGPASYVNGQPYRCVHPYREPLMAPDWLLVMCAQAPCAQPADLEIRRIPYGDHDRFLYALASYLRGREGLNQAAIEVILTAFPLVLLEGYDPSRPYTARDFRRIAASACRHPATVDDRFQPDIPSSSSPP